MDDWRGELSGRIERMAEDRESGATDLLSEAIAILRTAREHQVPIVEIARAICRAQPAMAPLWNAAVEAVAARQQPERFDRFAARVARSSTAIARFARDLFATADSSALHLVTLSASRSVRTAIDAIRTERQVRVSCAESRPALEGRRFAAALAASGLTVTCYLDGAVAHALADADAVLVGADAVGPGAFLNKSGTRMLAAAAAQQGVPVHVVAARDKFVPAYVWTRLALRDGAAAEVWTDPPAGVTVRNPYFEATPLDLVSSVISDAGVLGADLIPQVCGSLAEPAALAAFEILTAPADH